MYLFYSDVKDIPLDLNNEDTTYYTKHDETLVWIKIKYNNIICYFIYQVQLVQEKPQ